MTIRCPITGTVQTAIVVVLVLAAATSGCGRDTPEQSADASPVPTVTETPTAQPTDSGTSDSGLLVIPSENPVTVPAIADSDNTSPAPAVTIPKTPGIVSPKMYVTDEIDMPEDTAVIGIVVGGTARAYALEAMRPEDSHVVNELVGDLAIAVTYCPKADSVRIFSKSAATSPLQIAASGFRDNQLLIAHENMTYEQSTGTIPLDDVDFVRTEWLAWKIEHPDSVVYLGSQAAKYVPAKR